MMCAITEFKDTTRWLSNFWFVEVRLDGVRYTTVEHAYVAAKTMDLEKRKEIAKIPAPGKVKYAGRKLALRPDWEGVKAQIMLHLLRQKFAVGTQLGEWLEATGVVPIEEGNHWGDIFWGVYVRPDGERIGCNMLGKLIMQVRAENRVPKKWPFPR